MSQIFISYSHEDREFVDQMAIALVRKKARVWIDRWELTVGDSLVDNIQNAIEDAGAIIIVLSKASTASEWCKKELSAGLIKELEQREVIVLPVLKENCKIPLFLRDKVYADFRSSFDDGVRTLLEATDRVVCNTHGRESGDDYNIDWCRDWFEVDSLFGMKFTFVQFHKNLPFSLLTEITIIANEELTARYNLFKAHGLGWFQQKTIINTLYEVSLQKDMHVLITNNLPATKPFGVKDGKSDKSIECLISCRRLGEETGKDTFVDCDLYFKIMHYELVENGRKATPAEAAKIDSLISGDGASQ
jgi:CTP:molybdopterin cytidylyltransferase MocA